MKIIGGIYNNTPNSKAATAKAMRDAGYRWNEEKRHWCKGACEE